MVGYPQVLILLGFSRWLSGKESICNTGDTGDVDSIPGCGRFPRGGHGNPLQYSCLEDPMNRRGWRAAVHGVTKNRARLKWLSTHARSHWSSQSFLCWTSQNSGVKSGVNDHWWLIVKLSGETFAWTGRLSAADPGPAAAVLKAFAVGSPFWLVQTLGVFPFQLLSNIPGPGPCSLAYQEPIF